MLLRYAVCCCCSLLLHAFAQMMGYVDLNCDDFFYIFSVLVFSYALTYLCSPHTKDGEIWPAFQRSKIWKSVFDYLLGDYSIETEGDLNNNKNYIFTSFPHGTMSANHMLTMTDCCGMMSNVHSGERRDLAASVLFYIPIVREILLFLGNVDASAATANRQLKKGRSLLIFVGGEKEQLMTKPNEHKIYCASRYGFIKLALSHGVEIVPTYCYGENELYHVSDFAMPARQWLQKNFSIAISLCWGRGFLWLSPLKSKMKFHFGKPIPVPEKFKKKNTTDTLCKPSREEIIAHHEIFVGEMRRLFDRTKPEPELKLFFL